MDETLLRLCSSMSSSAIDDLLAVGCSTTERAVAAGRDHARVGLAVLGDDRLRGILVGDDLRGEQDRFQDFLLLEALADVGQIGPDRVAACRSGGT